MAAKMKLNTPAMWIRRNMLDSPGSSSTINQDRALTEAEIKVQRSLQKLSIPEWYLNNNSRPPKILTNGSPIQSRPSVWKEQSLTKTIVHSSPVMSTKNLTINRNGVLETEIGPPMKSPPKYKPRVTPRSPISKKRAASIQKSRISEKKLSGSRALNISRTYPRISPSRKIQNINLVFSQPSDRVLSKTIAVMDHGENSELNITQDSLEAINTSDAKDEDMSMSVVGDVSVVSTSSEIKARIARMPTRQLTYIKPWKSPMTSDKKIGFRMAPTPQNSPESFSSTLVAQPSPLITYSSPPVQRRSLFPAPQTPKEKPPPPPVTPRTIKPITSKNEDMCDSCKADAFKLWTPSPQSRPPNSFRFNLCSIDEKRPITPRLFQPAAVSSPSSAMFASTKKSLEPMMMKEKQLDQDDKSLVQEIIEELNEKCENSGQPTYITPGSKNFVKKLVKALEKGTTTRSNDVKKTQMNFQRVIEYSDEDEIESSEQNSEDDTKSAAISTSISYKDTDSSDSDIRSPTIIQNYNYDWNMNLQKNINDTFKGDSKTTRIEDDSVYWIPITKFKLPRTSSLLSMISRLSASPAGQFLPCVSPIRQNDGRKSQLSWGMTCRTSDYARTLRRIDETMILDSGYSDKSRGHSSAESSDETWFDDVEANNQRTSNGYAFRSGPYGRRSRALYLGRSFAI